MGKDILQDALPPEEMDAAKEQCQTADLVLCLGTRYWPWYLYTLARIAFTWFYFITEISVFTCKFCDSISCKLNFKNLVLPYFCEWRYSGVM